MSSSTEELLFETAHYKHIAPVTIHNRPMKQTSSFKYPWGHVDSAQRWTYRLDFNCNKVAQKFCFLKETVRKSSLYPPAPASHDTEALVPRPLIPIAGQDSTAPGILLLAGGSLCGRFLSTPSRLAEEMSLGPIHVLHKTPSLCKEF